MSNEIKIQNSKKVFWDKFLTMCARKESCRFLVLQGHNFFVCCKNSYDSIRYTYFHVTSRLSLMVPRSLMSTATVCGRAANRSLVSHETFPTTTWLARLFSSVTWASKYVLFTSYLLGTHLTQIDWETGNIAQTTQIYHHLDHHHHQVSKELEFQRSIATKNPY